jgi:hypothetical protein
LGEGKASKNRQRITTQNEFHGDAASVLGRASPNVATTLAGKSEIAAQIGIA